MTAFSALTGSERKPPKVVLLPPSAFADTWEEKPGEEVAIGIRSLGLADLDTARAEAASHVASLYDEETIFSEPAIDAFNDALIAWVVATATCDPNDAGRPFFETPQDVVPRALRPEAIRDLWEAYVGLQAGTLTPDAPLGDDEIAELRELLTPERLANLDRATAREVRKLLGYCRNKLAETPCPTSGSESASLSMPPSTPSTSL